MRRQFEEQPLDLREMSLAGHVALTGDILNLPEPYAIPPDRPYSFDARVDARMNYRTESILVVPLQGPSGNILGVLELINALDAGRVVPFGPRGGDEVLRGIAALLLRHSRSFSVVTRYGGDEFAIVLVNTPKDGALTYAERIRSVVAEYEFRHGIVTVSLGAASLPEDGACGDDLVVAADKALYDAKRLGRNRVAPL